MRVSVTLPDSLEGTSVEVVVGSGICIGMYEFSTAPEKGCQVGMGIDARVYARASSHFETRNHRRST